MSDLIIRGRISSFNVQKVLWLADELHLAYRHVELGGHHGGLGDPEFRALNPHGKVPVISDGALVVWESHAILRYLAATYAGETFWPASPAARSHIDRWLDWGQTAFQPDFMRLFWGFYRQPAETRDPVAIANAKRACEGRFAVLERELSARDWLAGSTFSLADMPIATALYRYVEMGAGMRLPPAVSAWYARLGERPAYRRRIMTDFSELAGRRDY